MTDPRRPALEINPLHTEIAAQEDKLRRTDDRIKYLETKRSKLEREAGATHQADLGYTHRHRGDAMCLVAISRWLLYSQPPMISSNAVNEYL
jgi:uncharacterized protein (DUF3084 family)